MGQNSLGVLWKLTGQMLRHNLRVVGGVEGGLPEEVHPSTIYRIIAWYNITILGRGGHTPDGGGRRGNNEPSSTLFVKNLSYSTTEDSLISAFNGCITARLPTDRETGKKRG